MILTSVRFFLPAVVLLVALGCEAEPQAGKPPLEFSFRKSQIVTKGMVVGIRNLSETESLTDFVLRVRGEDEQGSRSHRLDAPLEPQDTITVGWMELDGWKLKPGDTITVLCRQYQGDATAVVPKL